MHEIRKLNCSSVVIFWLILTDVAMSELVFAISDMSMLDLYCRERGQTWWLRKVKSKWGGWQVRVGLMW